MEPLEPAPVRKQGNVEKLGGQQGGHKTWKVRYFVLSDHLAYYNKQSDYASGATPNLIRLNAFFVSAVETFRKKGEAKPKSGYFEFVVHAYPKSMTCRTKEEVRWSRQLGSGTLAVSSLLTWECRGQSVMEEWIRAMMEPLEQMRVPIRDIRRERQAAEDALEETVKSGGSVTGAAAAAAASSS